MTMTSEDRNAPEFWDEYAFSYIKGKWFDIWRLRDPDNPDSKLITVRWYNYRREPTYQDL